MKLIPKDAVLAEIERLKEDALQKKGQCKRHGLEKIMHQISAYNKVLSFIAAIDVEDLDFDREYKEFVEDDPVYIQLVNPIVGKSIAKHFFRLGAAMGYPITATDRGMVEEIIINLKRVEQDYRINLTKEMEWLRNQVKKGE